MTDPPGAAEGALFAPAAAKTRCGAHTNCKGSPEGKGARPAPLRNPHSIPGPGKSDALYRATKGLLKKLAEVWRRRQAKVSAVSARKGGELIEREQRHNARRSWFKKVAPMADKLTAWPGPPYPARVLFARLTPLFIPFHPGPFCYIPSGAIAGAPFLPSPALLVIDAREGFPRRRKHYEGVGVAEVG